MKLLIVGIIILMIIALAQIMKVYEYSSRLRNKNEAEVTEDESKFNAGMMIVFLVVFMISSVWLILNFSSTVVGPSGSEHGIQIDTLYNWNWGVLLFVFFLTQPILFIFAAKYRARPGVKATFFSHSTKLELIWTVIPAVVLAGIIIFGLTIWNDITSTKEDTEKIELYAYQFGWFARYSGEDNELGKANFKVLDPASNPLGVMTKEIIEAKQATWDDEIAKLEAKLVDTDLMNEADVAKMTAKVERLKRQQIRLAPLLEAQTPEEDAQALNDIILNDTLMLMKGKDYEFKFRSRDVIHSAFFPHFRAQMNCVPGMVTQFTFKPILTTEEMRENPEIKTQYKNLNRKRVERGEDEVPFDYVLLCNKICGASHFNMQLKIVVTDSEKEYKAFKERKAATKSVAALFGANEETEATENTEIDNDSTAVVTPEVLVNN